MIGVDYITPTFCDFDIPDIDAVGYGLISNKKLSHIPHIICLNKL